LVVFLLFIGACQSYEEDFGAEQQKKLNGFMEISKNGNCNLKLNTAMV